ncbi:MAG: hypothetical protein ACI9J5_003496 [Paraglaciecola sp.]|jgi:hypothetical protein
MTIDLVVTNNIGEALLGKRLNRPAQGFWLVSSGRILKDESMKNAFTCLTKFVHLLWEDLLGYLPIRQQAQMPVLSITA